MIKKLTEVKTEDIIKTLLESNGHIVNPKDLSYKPFQIRNGNDILYLDDEELMSGEWDEELKNASEVAIVQVVLPFDKPLDEMKKEMMEWLNK